MAFCSGDWSPEWLFCSGDRSPEWLETAYYNLKLQALTPGVTRIPGFSLPSVKICLKTTPRLPTRSFLLLYYVPRTRPDHTKDTHGKITAISREIQEEFTRILLHFNNYNHQYINFVLFIHTSNLYSIKGGRVQLRHFGSIYQAFPFQLQSVFTSPLNISRLSPQLPAPR